MVKLVQFLIIILFLGCDQTPDAIDLTVCDNAYDMGHKGNFENSISLANECLSIKELPIAKREITLQVRAWGNYNLNNYNLAVEDQAKAIEIGANSVNAYTNYSLYLKKIKNFSESLNAAKKANELDRSNGGPSMPTQYHLGWAYFDNGNFEDAVIALTEGIPHQPDFPYAYYFRALSHEKINDINAAEEDLIVVSKLLEDENWRNNSDGLLPEVIKTLDRMNINRKWN